MQKLKWGVGLMGLLLTISAIIALVVGPTAFFVSIGAIFLITVVFTAFGLGAAWNRGAMLDGAKLAVDAQTVDSRRDEQLIRTMRAVVNMPAPEVSVSKPQTNLLLQAATGNLEDTVEGFFIEDLDG